MHISPGKKALDKIYKRRDRYEIPDWQRQKVWQRPKKQKLIDSILRGWKLPKFYFQKTSEEPEVFEVIDGQQRLTAIFEFFDGQLPLSKESAAEYGAEYYSKLPTKTGEAFDDFEIEYDLIEEAEEHELKEFFKRLQEGLRLTSSEKLNAVHSKLRDFLKGVSEHPFFKEKVSVTDKRYAHFDIVSKVAAIEIEGINTGLRYDDLNRIFEGQENFPSNSQVACRIQNALDYLNQVIPEKSVLLKNRTVVQAFLTLCCRIVANSSRKERVKEMLAFFEHFMTELAKQVELGQKATDSDYVRFQRSINANVKNGAVIRQHVLLLKLLSFNPTMADLFELDTIAEAGSVSRMKELAESIAAQISNLNAIFSAKHGEDLFKPTNKTVQAQNRIGKKIADFDGYKAFIEDLYFLFHEAVGTRLDGMTPPAFADVNDLRTDLQHDVDHGKAQKVRAKRKKIAAAFQRYAGVPSPVALAPERFPVVQLNLLAALEHNLQALMMTLPAKTV